MKNMLGRWEVFWIIEGADVNCKPRAVHFRLPRQAKVPQSRQNALNRPMGASKNINGMGGWGKGHDQL